jgi:hypothetical protein
MRTRQVSDPQVPETTIPVCVECGWPPAIDGRCLCFYPEQAEWFGRYHEYMAANLPRLRGLVGITTNAN